MAGPSPLKSTTPSSYGSAAHKGVPGRQKSQQTGVEVTVYPLPDRGVTNPSLNFVGVEPYTMDGTGFLSDRPCVVSCTTSNALQSGGQFTVVVKTAQHSPLVNNLSDDSWIDISFTNNGKKWHVMRGLIDEVRISQSVSGSGAYIVSQTIVGRSFQKIWATNPYYFNVNAYENLQGSLLLGLLNTLVDTDPKTVNRVFLRDILKALGNYNRGTWAMPKGMQGVARTFAESFSLFTDSLGFYRLPQIINASVLAMTGTGDLWSIAQQYSDPMFTELFTEQMEYINGKAYPDLDGTSGLPIGETAMTVVYRDKPFITVDPIFPDDLITRAGPVKQGPFFNLTTFTVERQQIQSSDLGTSGYERYNAFFTTPPPLTEDGQANFQLFQQPLWFEADMQKHGMRRMDISSVWSPDSNKFDALGSIPAANVSSTFVGPPDTTITFDKFISRRRALIKDWYCIGAQLLSGTLTLGCGAPHLKVGCRLRVPPQGNFDETSFYIESVSHSWSMPQGTRTQVGVTRGWIGSDTQLIAAVQQASSSYKQGTVGDGSVS
jgi:hypothetical protein